MITSTYPKILIHCQYVYGIGHLVRTLELANGLSNNFQVFILNGGEAVPNFKLPDSIKFIQLPAIYKEEHTDKLIPVDDSHTLKECLSKREIIINESVKEIKPDILITEHYPFGLLFESEVTNLLIITKINNPLSRIVCSVRDLIESSEGSNRDDHTYNLINQWYDLILVHGDNEFASLSKSFPSINKIRVQIKHTGYIVREIPKLSKISILPLILTSVAGGRIGDELLDAMINSHHKLKLIKDHKSVLFSGAFQKDFNRQKQRVDDLKSDCISIHSFNRQNYLEQVSNASLIISLGGYNSIVEGVSAKKPMLVYQREFKGQNKEQSLRIKLFHRAGYIDIILPEDLNVELLPSLIIKKMDHLEVPDININMNGVQVSCHLLMELLKKDVKSINC